jgi:diguanylate cyclase (GGDEF)-like protein
LTGLVNRSGFNLILQYEIAQNNRLMFGDGESRLGIIYGDLTGFKGVNDKHGHDAGDKALKHAAHVIKATTRDSDIVARFGGDEFGVILPDCDLKRAQQVAKRITEKFNEMPFMIDVQTVPLGINLGLCMHERDESANEFLARADRMMMVAKEQHYKDKGLTRRGAAPSTP